MNHTRIIALIAGTLLLVLIAFLRPLRFIDNLFYDLSFRFSAAPAADSVAIVAIDESSIAKVGAVPWSRATLARLVDRIREAGARVIVLDILFPRRSERGANDSLAAAFKQVPSLVLALRAGGLSGQDQSGKTGIPADVFKYRFMRLCNQELLGAAPFYRASSIGATDTAFTRYARYGGFINVSTSSSSQKLREAVQVLRVNDEFFPSLAMASVAAYRSLSPADMVLDGKGSIVLAGSPVPLSSHAGTTFINYRKGGVRTVPAAAVLDGTADQALLRGKLVFVGLTDPAAGADFFLTPLGPQVAGVTIWATVTIDIMQNAWVRFGGGVGSACSLLVLLLLFPGCIVLIPSSRRTLAVAAGSAILMASVAAGIILFKNSHYFWNPAGHLYGWLAMLLWLAAQRAVPALAELPPIVLDPSDQADAALLPPPKADTLQAPLPATDTAQFALKKAAPSGADPRAIAGGTIIKCLGSGGMADVYLVWNPRLEVYRAVKIIKPGQKPGILDRFETEIRIFSKLDHPNIVDCHSVGDWWSLPYLEMEYINGASMEEVLGNCTALTVQQALAVAILVCRALHYAHNQTITIYGTTYKGIVHRDLKPANIMLCRGGTVKLTDFGIARPGAVSLHTQHEGVIVGTLPYLAPEQVDESELTGQADVYAMGATLYEFLTGRRAFPQTTIPAILNAKMQGTYAPIKPSAQIGREVIAVVEKAMAVRREERYPSAAAFKNDLERLLRPLIKTEGSGILASLAGQVFARNVPVSQTLTDG